MVVSDKYGLVSVEQADGEIFVKKIVKKIPEMPYLKLGDFEVNRTFLSLQYVGGGRPEKGQSPLNSRN
jgi:hypothetical protein